MRSQDAVRFAANKYGKAVVTKLYEWSSENLDRSYSVDVKWKDINGVEKGKFVSKIDLMRVVSSIGLTSDTIKRIISVKGILAGGDIITKRFHFVDDNDEDYRGGLSNELTAETLELGRRYVARIAVEATSRYATEEEQRRYTLMALENDPHA